MTSTAQTASLAFAAPQARQADGASVEASSRTAAPARQAFTGSDLLLRAAAFVVLTAASTALLALPYVGDASDALETQSGPSARLEQAFQVAQVMPAQDELMEALSAAARKTDRLTSGQDCGAQTWPYVHPRCLAGTDGSASAAPVRTVTVEYRMGDNVSALVRLPVQQLASQP